MKERLSMSNTAMSAAFLITNRSLIVGKGTR